MRLDISVSVSKSVLLSVNKPLPTYLLCTPGKFHCCVSSGVPYANHHDSFVLISARLFVVMSMQHLTLKDYSLSTIVHIYRPQTKFAKVMFLHLSVSPFVHRVVVVHPPPDRYTPQAGTPPWADTPRAGTPPGRYTPLGRHPLDRHPPRQVHPRDGQWAGGTHPTGMHSCFYGQWVWRNLPMKISRSERHWKKHNTGLRNTMSGMSYKTIYYCFWICLSVSFKSCFRISCRLQHNRKYRWLSIHWNWPVYCEFTLT